MKFSMSVVCLALSAASLQAEPARKSPAKAVDMDAAARATAALYASMSAPAVPTPVPVQPAARPTPVVTSVPVAAPSKSVLPAVPATPRLPEVGNAPMQAAPAQLAVSDVWVGAYHCEFSEKVQLRPDTLADHVELQWKGQRWKMRRTDSRSGALRLEDATARMVWIQLADKSMLLDQRQGRRLLDECQHDVQMQTAAQMKNNLRPMLFDTSGMGR